MTNINFFSIIKRKLSFNLYGNQAKEIREDNATIKKSLVSTANDFSTHYCPTTMAVSDLSAKIQDSVNAQASIWTQFL